LFSRAARLEGMWRLTIGHAFDVTARQFPDREALVAEGRRWTWRELAADVDRVARALIRLGVEPGDRIALWSANRPEWLHVLFATVKIGAIAVPLRDDSTLADAEDVVRRTACRLRITAAPSALPSLLIDDPTWTADRATHAELAARQAAVEPGATALILQPDGATSHAILADVIAQASRLAIGATASTLLARPMSDRVGLCEGPLMSAVTGARLILASCRKMETCVLRSSSCCWP
jgi:fatty-acyl-CoA synthase